MKIHTVGVRSLVFSEATYRCSFSPGDPWPSIFRSRYPNVRSSDDAFWCAVRPDRLRSTALQTHVPRVLLHAPCIVRCPPARPEHVLALSFGYRWPPVTSQITTSVCVISNAAPRAKHVNFFTKETPTVVLPRVLTAVVVLF